MKRLLVFSLCISILIVIGFAVSYKVFATTPGGMKAAWLAAAIAFVAVACLFVYEWLTNRHDTKRLLLSGMVATGQG